MRMPLLILAIQLVSLILEGLFGATDVWWSDLVVVDGGQHAHAHSFAQVQHVTMT